MAEPSCKTCKHFDAAMRGKGGECSDLTKLIFVRNSVPSQASPPWIQDEDIYTCLNHATRDESPNEKLCRSRGDADGAQPKETND